MAKDDALTRFSRAAAALGVTVEAVRYPEGTRTAAEAAAAIGCEVSQIVKSLVLITPLGPLLAFTAGHHRVDLDAVSAWAGADVRMATANEARAATGYAIGGTPPFGHPEPIPSLIDPSLLDHALVYGAAGLPDACFAIEPDVLLRVTGARREAFTEP